MARKFFSEDAINRLDVTHPDSIFSTTEKIYGEMGREYKTSAEVDSAVISMSIKEITSHPFRHLLMCVPFAWKGIFVEIDNHFLLPASLISLLLFMGFFAFVLRALIKREWEYVAFVLLPLYLFGMLVLLTWCNPRQNKPLIPILWITSLYFLLYFYRKCLPWIKDLLPSK